MSDQKQLKDILKEMKVKGENIADHAGSIQKTGSFVKDFAEVSIEEFDKSPLASNPSVFIKSFQPLLKDLRNLEFKTAGMTSLASAVTYGTANAMTTLSGVNTNYTYRSNPAYTLFYTKFDEVIDRGQTKEQAISAIKKLRLDSFREGKEAISLLESAWDVHTQGIGISTSSLIPLREAIAKTLQLLHKRSAQSKVKDWILDLGKKVAFSYISNSELQNLQDEHNIIRDKLSGSKKGTYSRDEERRLLRDGTLHLLKILNMIDINKLK